MYKMNKYPDNKNSDENMSQNGITEHMVHVIIYSWKYDRFTNFTKNRMFEQEKLLINYYIKHDKEMDHRIKTWNVKWQSRHLLILIDKVWSQFVLK